MKEIEIPDGCEAKIVGSKVVFVPKESEDERIRTDILEALRYGLACEESTLMPGAKTTLKEAIAYLERQKEQKSIEDVIKNITKNKEAATKFLKSAGIMDDNGELAEMYRSESKPAEWSEEDDALLKEIVSFFKDGTVKLQHDLDLYAGFLEKRLKSLHPQPHWKPSEEQIKAIDLAIRFVTDDFDEHPTLSETLRGLYSELKNL